MPLGLIAYMGWKKGKTINFNTAIEVGQTIPLLFDDTTQKWAIKKSHIKGRLKINLNKN